MADSSDAPVAPGKRGRRQSLPDPGTGPVAVFAHALATLKVDAGDPSYDRMRGELGAIASKSALSAAARGRDLPSWETTWEFVRSLTPPGTDLEPVRSEWRQRWDAARDADPAPTPEPTGVPVAPRSAWRRDRRLLVLGLAIGATVGGVFWALVAAGSAPAPPIEGDASRFVAGEGDVTIPDGTVVVPGERFVKIWEIRNVGTVPWLDRYLERQPGGEAGACRAPDRVPVPRTDPGTAAQVSVEVQASPGPGRCKVRWKMVDEQGRAYFPKLNGVFYDVTVAG